MKRLLLTSLILSGCASEGPEEHYGFVTLLGQDTVSVESVTRRGSDLTVDAVDRFPRVRHRHAEVRLGPDGGVQALTMVIRTPSEPDSQRVRQVEASVADDTVRITKTDGTGTLRLRFPAQGATALAHVPQMYSLYEQYFMAARLRAERLGRAEGDTVRLRQFYLDREFDRFPLHRGTVRFLAGNRAEISHDWLSGTGEAALDSVGRLLSYSGARTTYDVRVTRVDAPDVRAAGERFEAAERAAGGMRSLSVRDTARARIGAASFAIDYGRPLARGRELVGGLIPFDRIWRTGANAATQLTVSAPVTIAGLSVPAGTYTLWTIPRKDGAELIINRQTGQWGTEYGRAHDLGRARMRTDTLAVPVEQFTIGIDRVDERSGLLTLSWGPFRWSAPINVR